MSLTRIVRSRVSERCIVKKCRKKGCTVSLKEAPSSRLIIDCDRPLSPFSQDESRCDYIFFSDTVDGDESDVVGGNE